MKSKFLIAAAAATISAPTGVALAADAASGDAPAAAPAPAASPATAPAPAPAAAAHSARWQHLHNHLLGDNVHLTRRLHGDRAAHRALSEHDAWSNHRLGRANRRLRRQLSAHTASRHAATPAVMQRIAQCESGGNPHAVGGGGRYRGKYQFDQQTWRANGGKGDPAAASEADQDRVAMRLYKKRGTSPWPTCGR
jgi:hypothetical protein